MRYTGPKARKVRRFGMDLYGSEKYIKILQKHPNGPGKEPKAHKGKLSEYGRQLLEKQKVCAMYGLTDSQLNRLYKEASRAVGQTDRQMQSLLERRLDSALYRAGLALTRLQARQFISHGLFTINGVRATIPSMRVKTGDSVVVRGQSKASAAFPPVVNAHQRYSPPDWISADMNALKFEVKALPLEDKHFEQTIDMRKVVGFYSR